MAARQTSVVVGTSNVLIADDHLSTTPRIEIIFTNVSTAGQVISLAAGTPAVAGTGIVLQPNQSYAASIDSAYPVYQGAWNAIASAAAGTLAIFER